jgi:hypothetical protein
MGDAGTALIQGNEARELATLAGDLYEEARALLGLARCAARLGDYRKSTVQLHRAKEILGICGVSGGRLDTRINSFEAEVHLLKSEYIEAKSIHTQILQLTDQDPFMNACEWVNIAQIDVMLGTDGEEVHQNLKAAQTIFDTIKYAVGLTWCKIVSADLKLNIPSAEQILMNGLNLAWGKQTDAMSFCLERFADRSRWCVAEPTSTWPIVYLAHAEQSKDKLALHKALLFLGDQLISEGDDDTAHNLFMVSLEGFVWMDVHQGRGQSLLRLGDLANRRGNFSNATELSTAARPLFERSFQAKDVAQIDARLADLDDHQTVLFHGGFNCG